MKIGHPWIREAAAGAPSTYACIIEIENDGDEPETLLGATVDGGGTGVLYQIIEKDGHFSSKIAEHGLLIKPHGSIELPPTTYQFKFGKITKALTADSMVEGTLVFEKLHACRSTSWSNRTTRRPRKTRRRRNPSLRLVPAQPRLSPGPTICRGRRI